MNLSQTPLGRRILFTLLYASEGGPIGFIWWALPTLLRADGVPVERITRITSLLVLPWILKFLWAPMVDGIRGSRWGFRGWIFLAQFSMGLALLPLLWLSPVHDLRAWVMLLLFHALAAATQDVAIDAWAINITHRQERGTINGCMQAGLLLGRSLFGGIGLLVAARWGIPWLVIGLVALIWGSASILWLAGEEKEALVHCRDRSLKVEILKAARSQSTWLGLGFALSGAAAFEAVGALAGPYLIDRGSSEESVGIFFGFPVVVAMIAGGLIGGGISDRIGRRRSVGLFLLGFVLVIAILATVDGSGVWATSSTRFFLLTLMYLFVGLFTAASYALFMDLTDKRLGGTQFSAFMAATNGCESWSGWMGGQLAATSGYAATFGVMCLISGASLLLLRSLKPRTPAAPAAALPLSSPLEF